MGSRKKIAADKRKEERKLIAIAKLNNVPTSPRKMRLVADVIRGEEVLKSLNMLKHMPQDAAKRLEKLVLSALANWQAKNEDKNADEEGLIVKEIFVDSARMLKRLRPAPQGRAHRIRKRSNHVTIILDSAK
ncbi:50S ribosomal protein L22 [Cryomorpha ignava]|uniref:Large ribosomal subunit protein uL22 n=1 Tax=Cryomorpha ignava TaxID=101383 RepID=A0A7K3WP74_9FLAO|nr:50S ribosomal protein L22 [Cryomorpha ignava]NEN23453.1 50S ribosomal protein L22 [Cryomorpha ignava]